MSPRLTENRAVITYEWPGYDIPKDHEDRSGWPYVTAAATVGPAAAVALRQIGATIAAEKDLTEMRMSLRNAGFLPTGACKLQTTNRGTPWTALYREVWTLNASAAAIILTEEPADQTPAPWDEDDSLISDRHWSDNYDLSDW